MLISVPDNVGFLDGETVLENEKHFKVEKLLKHNLRSDSQYEYLVKWKNYNNSFNLWESQFNFDSLGPINKY